MPTTRFEDQPWYPRAKEAIERVVAAQMKRDSAESGTAEREAIEREYEAALAAFRSIGAQVKKDGPTPAAGVGFFRSGLEFVTGGAGADFSGKTAMPRYRFHIRWTDRKNDDETGMFLADDAAARDYAERLIREIKDGDGQITVSRWSSKSPG